MQQITSAPRSPLCSVSMRTLGNLRHLGSDTTVGRPGNWGNGRDREKCILLALLEFYNKSDVATRPASSS